MKLKLSALILLSVLSMTISAQDAKSILDKASEAYNKSGAVTVSFTLDTQESKTKNIYSYDGKAYMSGDKFKIEIPDAITWFNGKTQWVYIKDTEEVNISNPSNEELQSISPSVLFSIYKKGYNLKYKGDKRLGGKTLQQVELLPQKKGADIAKILVEIDKNTNIFSSITITDKAGVQSKLTIKKYQPNSNIADNIFSFSKNDYPKAEIVDLR